MRNPQKVINASWRMMMDNAGLSVADQIVVNKEIVSPADGSWEMAPKKVWNLVDKTRSVAEAFASFSTPSHQTELGNIFSMARQLADEETNLPLIAQGEMSPNMTKTSSGMAMLMNSSNIVLRKAVKNWDDDITRPLITRFYDWNMQFSERAEVKGDFSVEARGSGALLVREKQQENLMIYSNISMQNPEYFKRRDWAELDREIAKSLELPYDQITISETEIAEREAMAQEAAAQGMPDPAMQKLQLEAELAQARLQIEQQKIQLDAQYKAAVLQQSGQEMALDHQLERDKMAQKERMDMSHLTSKYQISERTRQTGYATAQERNKTERDKAAAQTNVKLTEAQLKAQNIANSFDTF